jgi:predicted Zn-dependent protease with MMP-like domain
MATGAEDSIVPHRVSKSDFADLVELALAELPEQFAEYLQEVAIEIRDRPSAAQLKSVGLGRRDLLLGLYHGRPRTQRSVLDGAVMPDVIYLFQEDIEQVSDSEPHLIEEVRKTVLHEIGHHFGMSEDDLDKLGYR